MKTSTFLAKYPRLQPLAPLIRETEPLWEFFHEGTVFLHKCTKPDGKQMIKMVAFIGGMAIALGMTGFTVRLLAQPLFSHVPIY